MLDSLLKHRLLSCGASLSISCRLGLSNLSSRDIFQCFSKMLIWSGCLPWPGPLFFSSAIVQLSSSCMWLSGLKMRHIKFHEWDSGIYTSSARTLPSAFIHQERKDIPHLPSLGSHLWSISLQLVTLHFLPPPYSVEILNTLLLIMCWYNLFSHISHSLA